jgi:nitrate reductase beta subunit
MTFYIPPLSPVLAFGGEVYSFEEHDGIPQLEKLRVPITYLANLLAAGNTREVEKSLRKLIALRAYMRAKKLGEEVDLEVLRAANLDEKSASRLYRLLSLASYEERFAIPGMHRETEESYHVKGGRAFGVLAKPRGGL